jgi:hypothetical protein
MIDIDLGGNETSEVVLMAESILAHLVEGKKLVDKKLVEEGYSGDRNLMRQRIHRLILCHQHYLGRLHCCWEGCCILVHHGEGSREGEYDVPVPVHEGEEGNRVHDSLGVVVAVVVVAIALHRLNMKMFDEMVGVDKNIEDSLLFHLVDLLSNHLHVNIGTSRVSTFPSGDGMFETHYCLKRTFITISRWIASIGVGNWISIPICHGL